jgi:hypothetical protein
MKINKDRIDLDDIEYTTATKGYGLIEKRIRETIAQTERKLRTCSVGELEVMQREIQTLELVLRFPQMIAREIQQKCP